MKIVPRRRDQVRPFLGLDDLFDRFWGSEPGNGPEHLPEVFRKQTPFPALNVAETEDSYLITLDCPGLEEEDLQVEVMGNRLILSGERKWEEESKDKDFRRVEAQYGHFERTVDLPSNARLNGDDVKAKYKKGVLSLRVPKVEKTPNARITVEAGD